MTAVLLDVNLLIALAWPNHIHHRLATHWFRQDSSRPFATCPITEAGFVRLSMNSRVVGEAASFQQATHFLAEYCKSPDHVFWSPDVDVASATNGLDVSGHRQVTDAYLLAVAQLKGGRLATLDSGIREIIPPGSLLSKHLLIVET